MKKISIIVIVGICVWLIATSPHLMINPGELIKGHQDLNNKCNSCHEPFWGISTEKCITCHKLDEIGKDSLNKKETVLFHRNLKNTECSSCHTDHKGIRPSITLSRFDHTLLSSAEQIKCAACHVGPTDKLHSKLSANCNACHSASDWKSSATFDHKLIQMTDQNNCLSCHQKPKDEFHSSFSDRCIDCHSTDKWSPSSFNHSAYFILDQNHNAKCSTCHADNNFRAYTCYGCHEHSEGKIQSEHREEGISNFSNCVSCHRSGNEHDIRMNESNTNELNSKEVDKVKNYIKSQDKGKEKEESEDDD